MPDAGFKQLSLPFRASEVAFGSEVHYVSEVSPGGEVRGSPKRAKRVFGVPEVGKLNFTLRVKRAKLHCEQSEQLHFCVAKTSPNTERN